MKAACHRIARAIEVFTDIHNEFDDNFEESDNTQKVAVQSGLSTTKPPWKTIKLTFSSDNSDPHLAKATTDVCLPLVRVKGLSITYPSSLVSQDGNNDCEGITFDLRRGDSLLITGPSGVGKSSVLRAISGIWRLGSGEIIRPKEAVFLPQTVYMATPPATLRTQLLFPNVDEPVPNTELVA